MSAPPYMKLYVGDYLGDTHHLAALEHGAYLLLLMAMWRAGGSLPAADANLAKIARCTASEWASIRATVLAFFTRSRGRLTHKRLTHEFAKYESISGKRSEAAKRGVREKRIKNNDMTSTNGSDLFNKREPIGYITRTITSSEDKSSGDEVAVIDPDKAAWDMGVMVLTKLGGMAEKPARAFIGRLLSQHHLTAKELLPTFSAVLANQSGDPAAYIAKSAAGMARRRAGAEAPKRVGWV